MLLPRPAACACLPADAGTCLQQQAALQALRRGPMLRHAHMPHKLLRLPAACAGADDVAAAMPVAAPMSPPCGEIWGA